MEVLGFCQSRVSAFSFCYLPYTKNACPLKGTLVVTHLMLRRSDYSPTHLSLVSVLDHYIALAVCDPTHSLPTISSSRLANHRNLLETSAIACATQ